MARINEILIKTAELKPHQYSDETLVGWISALEHRVVDEIIMTHEKPGVFAKKFRGYTLDDTERELMVPEPYSDMYTYYIYAMIDFNNAETDRYANSMEMFNSAYGDYANYYNRTHMPLSEPATL